MSVMDSSYYEEEIDIRAKYYDRCERVYVTRKSRGATAIILRRESRERKGIYLD